MARIDIAVRGNGYIFRSRTAALYALVYARTGVKVYHEVEEVEGTSFLIPLYHLGGKLLIFFINYRQILLADRKRIGLRQNHRLDRDLIEALIGKVKNIRIQKILRYEGLTPQPIEEAGPGDIILIAGLDNFDIGDTLSSTNNPVHLPRIHIDPPTISMLFTVNTSPLAGKYGGKFMTGNQLQERLERAHMADPALLVEKVDGASTFKVSGRGILHLTILVENMRRELYEFTIGSPQVIFKNDENGKLLEPIEEFKVEVPNEFSGACIQEINTRKGEMVNMTTDENDRVTLEYLVPSRGLIGIRPKLLSLSKGYAISQSIFKDYEPYKGEIPARVNGVLIAKEPGEAASYALSNLEDRGYLIIGPGAEVYPGMIVGEHNRDVDIIVNVTKGKHLTNMRSKSADDMIQLTPYRRLTLEECVTFINEDECIEVTPEVLRLRKTELDPIKRKQLSKRPAEED